MRLWAIPGRLRLRMVSSAECPLWALSGVHKDMDEELAYQLTKAFVETLPQLMAKAPFASNVGFDDPASGVCGPSPYKYHPGAVRAWEGLAIHP